MKLYEQIPEPKNSFDLKNYRLPKGKKDIEPVRSKFPELPRNEGNVDFDIYDYQMLFKDEGTKKIIREGNTIGCFYIESPGMRSLLRRLHTDTFEMLTAASSVIRPGVAESGMMKEFIERHKNPKLRKYLVPEMKEHLEETYGVMIYQEDVIKVAHHIAGLTLEEADLLRRAMSGKMRSKNAMELLSNRFFESCKTKGLSDYVAKELWRQISSFAGYAFCKAHSASFAILSFQVAFLKVHFPAEFMAAVLSNGGGYYSAAVYIQESKRLGLKVLLPSINHSEFPYQGGSGFIRIGFMAVKNLTKKTAERIISEREAEGDFGSLKDFLVRVRCGYEDASILIKCGAMDCLGKTRPTLMRLLELYHKYRKSFEQDNYSLFKDNSSELEKQLETKNDYSVTEKCRLEFEYFGYMVTKHPLNFFDNIVNHRAVTQAADMGKMHGKTVRMVGWYMASKRIKTSKGEIMKFLSLEDLTGTFEAVIFPEKYKEYAELTLSMGPYFIKGKVDAEGGNNIVVEKMTVLSGKEVQISTNKDSAENKYFGDIEKFESTEIDLIEKLGKENLRKAYL